MSEDKGGMEKKLSGEPEENLATEQRLSGEAEENEVMEKRLSGESEENGVTEKRLSGEADDDELTEQEVPAEAEEKLEKEEETSGETDENLTKEEISGEAEENLVTDDSLPGEAEEYLEEEEGETDNPQSEEEVWPQDEADFDEDYAATPDEDEDDGQYGGTPNSQGSRRKSQSRKSSNLTEGHVTGTDFPSSYATAHFAEDQGDTDEAPEDNYPPYDFGNEGPKTVEELYTMIEPDREVGFNEQIELLNKQLLNVQHQICLEHKERQIKKARKFQFEKEFILSAVSEAGILCLPGNFLEPTTGIRVEDKDLPYILEALKDMEPEAELKGFNFAYNNLTDDGIAIIAEYVKERPAIIHLNLSHNDFTGSGLHNLVTHLISRASLETLKLTGVKVGDEGIDSVTCLYMCGKGPRDLDIGETDMTAPGFQALCTAFQAVDDDEDFPNFLTKYKLPFSLETLAGYKIANQELLKSQASRVCHSQFELIASTDSSRSRGELLHQQSQEGNDNQDKTEAQSMIDDSISKALENALGASLLGGGDADSETIIDLSKEAEMSVEINEKAQELLPIDDFIEAHNELRQHKGCASAQPNGRPVIICPSLYSLEIDEFDDDTGEAIPGKGTRHLKKVNPSYMDTLVEPPDETEMDMIESEGRDAVDTMTAEKSAVKFIRHVFKESGAVAGISEYPNESDRAQMLLMTILDTAKAFLQAETENASEELSQPELKLIWEHSLEKTMQIFHPAIPSQCRIADGALDSFVEEFMKISSRTFYSLLQLPFFQELFESAAAKEKECIEVANKKKQFVLPLEPNDMSYLDCVQNVIIKFLEGVIARASDIVGGGDPLNLRRTTPKSADDRQDSPTGQDQWPSIMDLTEERVEPLVDQLFEAGGMMAEDALACKEEDEKREEEGIEPARQYLEGIFKQLTNFLIQMKDDEKKLAERKKFTFSTKPVRLVLNRPLFNGHERVLASKLSTYLRNNESVQCLHCRKWALGEDGTVNLMNGIVSNMTIVTLDLSLNGIGVEGVQAIGEYMKRNHNLKHLLLNHNRLRNPGMIALAGAIPESSLISLNVAHNDSNEGGLNPLLEAIEKSKIYSLYTLGNCFSQTSCTLLWNLFETKVLNQPDCDLMVQDVDGEKFVGVNSQARDTNEWYEVPVRVDTEFVCPPYYRENYTPPTPPKVSTFGLGDIECELNKMMGN